MSKTNKTSREELTVDQLDAVNGGAFPIVMAQMALLRPRSSGGGVDVADISITKPTDASSPG
jgi:hypothetical protein